MAVLYNGQYQNVLGEAGLCPAPGANDYSLARIDLSGIILPSSKPAFSSVHVTVCQALTPPRHNGMVQVESMFSGNAVVATDLTGVRHAVRTHRHGKDRPPEGCPGHHLCDP